MQSQLLTHSIPTDAVVSLRWMLRTYWHVTDGFTSVFSPKSVIDTYIYRKLSIDASSIHLNELIGNAHRPHKPTQYNSRHRQKPFPFSRLKVLKLDNPNQIIESACFGGVLCRFPVNFSVIVVVIQTDLVDAMQSNCVFG